MKKYINNPGIGFLVIFVFGRISFTAEYRDKTKIKKLIAEAFVDGLQNQGNPEKTRKGFDYDLV